jgi:hypothetical protein
VYKNIRIGYDRSHDIDLRNGDPTFEKGNRVINEWENLSNFGSKRSSQEKILWRNLLKNKKPFSFV